MFKFDNKFGPWTNVIETNEDEHGRFFRARIETDDSNETPWENSDVHGVVTQWKRKDGKLPGERILAEDRGDAIFYNVQQSVRKAKENGWGCSHDHHKTKGERAACAVEEDFEYLRAWCNDEWSYVGVVVSFHQETDDDVIELGDHLESLWGIEDNAYAYLSDIADDLLEEAMKTQQAHYVVKTEFFGKCEECGFDLDEYGHATGCNKQ